MTPEDRSMQAVLSYTEDLPRLSYSPGETLIAEGPSSGLLYILIDGAVEILRGDVRVAEHAGHLPQHRDDDIFLRLRQRHQMLVFGTGVSGGCAPLCRSA